MKVGSLVCEYARIEQIFSKASGCVDSLGLLDLNSRNWIGSFETDCF